MKSGDSQIKKIIFSLLWMIGYLTIFILIFWNSVLSISFIIFFTVVPILLGWIKIWGNINYLSKIKKIAPNLKKIAPYLKKTVPYLKKTGFYLKKIGAYIFNSYRNSYNTPGKPKAVFWFQIYCQVMIILSVLVFSILFFNEVLDDYVLLVFSLIFQVAISIPPLFLPRKHWVWIYNVTLLGISATWLILIPVSVPLIVLYAKPEDRKYYKS